MENEKREKIRSGIEKGKRIGVLSTGISTIVALIPIVIHGIFRPKPLVLILSLFTAIYFFLFFYLWLKKPEYVKQRLIGFYIFTSFIFNALLLLSVQATEIDALGFGLIQLIIAYLILNFMSVVSALILKSSNEETEEKQ